MYFGLIAFGLVAGLFGLLIGLVVQILFLLNLTRLVEAVQPQNRAISPGHIWLNLIPIFNLGWMIYTVLKIRDSVRSENAVRQGSTASEETTHTIGLVYSIAAAAGFVLSFGRYAGRGFSAFGVLVSLAVLVLWIMYWVRTNRMRRDLEMAAGGHGPGGPYWPGGQYSPGGPYSPGGGGYGTGGSGYGAGPGPGASYGVGPAAQSGDTPAAWQPPASAPPPAEGPSADTAGSGSGDACSQCGNKLDPKDQFCAACGTPAPKE